LIQDGKFLKKAEVVLAEFPLNVMEPRSALDPEATLRVTPVG
jgi:hypothetical protein